MLHPSYTRFDESCKQRCRRRGNKDRQQSLFDRYGNIETCQTTDCRRPSACRCEEGEKPLSIAIEELNKGELKIKARVRQKKSKNNEAEPNGICLFHVSG